jgi:hypothetical protein
MRIVKSLLRAAAALALMSLLVAFLSVPVCFSAACSMSGAERAACKAMGRECCGTKGGQVPHAPAAPTLVLAAAPASLTINVSALKMAAVADLSREASAVPAILQGVGLFTLFDVFLI